MNFLNQIKASFTDFNEYRTFATQGMKKTVAYLTLLFTILFVVGGLPLLPSFNPNAAVQEANKQIPDFKIEGGKLEVYEKQPITVGSGDGKIIIDTTGKTSESVLGDAAKGMLVTSDKVYIKQETQEQIFRFSDVKELSLTKQSLVDALPKFIIMGIIIGALVGYLSGWISMAITAAILALIGLAINAKTKGALTFGNLWSAAVYALTLPWIVETVKNMIYPELPLFGIIKWGLAIYLIYRGIQAVNASLPADTSAEIQTP